MVFVGIITYRKHCWYPLHQKQAACSTGNNVTTDMVVGFNGVSMPINRPGMTSDGEQMSQR